MPYAKGNTDLVCQKKEAHLSLVTMQCLQANKDDFSGLLLFALPAVPKSTGADNLNGLVAALLQNHCYPVGCD